MPTTTGTENNDLIIGTDGDDTIYGLGGDDIIEGNAGNDDIWGGAGADVINGGAGEDILRSADNTEGDLHPDNAYDRGVEVDQINGGEGDDYISIGYGDSADGGEGFDLLVLSLASMTGGITFDLNSLLTGAPVSLGGGTIQNFEGVQFFLGTDFADILTAATQGPYQEILAGGGNDVIIGQSTSVSVRGGDGDDLFISGAEGDYFLGDAGIDTVDYRYRTSGVLVALDGSGGTDPGFEGLVGVENVTGSDYADGLYGDDQANVLRGGQGDDELNGRAGADILEGGAGNDWFLDYNWGLDLDGDTITDFAPGDQIVFGTADFTTFTFSLSGNTLTYTGGSLTLEGDFSGYQLVASAMVGGGVQLALQGVPVIADVRNDFNGDGRSDILWRNVDGTLSNWLGQANGGYVANDANAAVFVPTDWHVIATGDLNGDGRDDILWRHDDGTISNWLGQANGGFVENNANGAVHVPTDWNVMAVADFNGDGRDDILWRQDSGTISNWLGTAAGGYTPNNANAAVFVPTEWGIASTGDFNGDGRDDILWRHSDGTISNWLGTATGGYSPNDANAAVAVPNDWSIIGTGDFNGDGRDDILWRHTDGTISNWLGTASGGWSANDVNAAVNVPLAWSVAAIGDYNGDGRDDILWRHNDGTISNWLGTASGGWTANDANAAAAVPTVWHVQPEDYWL